MRSEVPVLLALSLFLIGCLKEKPVELEFVELNLETPSVEPLNKVALRANVSDLINGSLQERGFLLSTSADDENSLVLGPPDVISVAPDMIEEKRSFTITEWRADTVGAPYFVRAYVIFENSVIYSQTIRSFEFPFRLNLIQPVRFSRDTVILNGVMTGIGEDTIEDRGFIVTQPDGARFKCSSGPAMGQSEEGNFECRVGDLAPGTYLANAYAFFQGLDTLFSSETVRFTVDAGKPRFLDCGSWDTSFENDPGLCGKTVTLLKAFPIEAFDNQGIHRILYRSGKQDYELLPEGYRDTFPVGITAVEFIAEDIRGNRDTCAFEVLVEDTTSPEISCPPAKTVCDIGDLTPYSNFTAFVNAGGEASDNCALDESTFLLQSETSEDGTCPEIITRTYAIADAQSNAGICRQLISIDDKEPPSINCPGNLVRTTAGNNCDETVSWPSPEGSDNCGAPLIRQTAGPASGSEFPIGTTTITYQATDDCKNVAECSFTVTVRPGISCPSDTIVSVSSGQNTAVVDNISPQHCREGTVLSYVLTGATTGSGNGDAGDTAFNLGTTTVTYRVVHTGNALDNTCNFSVTVQESE